MFKTNHQEATRAGRLVFGLVMVGGALLIVAHLIAGFHDEISIFGWGKREPVVLRLIKWTWAYALGAGAITHALVRWVRPLRIVVSRGLRRGAPSFVAATVGTALLLPITIQLIFLMANGDRSRELEGWVAFALPATAVAHVAFAWMAGYRAARLARGEEPPSVKRIYAWCLVLSIVPVGVYFFFIPFILVIVAITGIPILPLLVLMEPLATPHRDSNLPVAHVLA